MKKEIKFYVIGGQYDAFCYGSASTLLGAKRLASKNIEYWDNWQGWNYPNIYKAEDTEVVDNFYGKTRTPKEQAEPVAYRLYGDKWTDWQ